MADFQMRHGRASDFDDVFALLIQFATSYRPSRKAFDQTYPSLPEAENSRLLVADQNNKIVGYALAFDFSTLYANGVVTELQELMVEPDARQRGIGTALVREVIAQAKSAGAVEITVPTRLAGDFYRIVGFEETAADFTLRR